MKTDWQQTSRKLDINFQKCMLVCPLIAGKQEHYVSALHLFVESKYSLTIAWFTSAVGFNAVNNTYDCSNRNVVREKKGKNPLICIQNSNNAVNPTAITGGKRKEQI